MSELNNDKSSLEMLGKIAICLTSLCYVVGLIAVNSYLSIYNFYSLSLFRTSYIAAGVWALSPIFIALFVASITMMMVSKDLPKDKSKKLSRIKVLMSIFSGIVVGWLTMFFIFAFLNIKLGLDWFVFSIAGCFLFLGVMGTMRIWWNPQEIYSRATQRGGLSVSIFSSCGAVVAVIAYAIFFGTKLYTRIPSTFGGGQPREVQLVLKDEDAKSLGPIFEDQQNRTKKLNLITDDDKVYLLSLPSGQTISINRDVVKVVYFGNITGSRQNPFFHHHAGNRPY